MILELENLTKLYKNGRGAEDISFTLASGEVLGLLGPNGSGKTTTMKAIAGLVRPTRGSVRICGINALQKHEEAMRRAGCLIEAPALHEHMTAYDNLNLAARFYKTVNDVRVDEVLRMVEMDKYKKEKVASFSLGMRQRIGLALALLSDPELLILDEPANGLDIEGMVAVREVVKKAAERGAAVLISSHLAHEIEQCATRAGILFEGKLLSVESMDGILASSPSLEDYFLSQIANNREEVAI
ncbi:MAG: ATP-binding cassette domain-containing protein [Peptococcaceae bacterium]|jgi:ABC-2 type transport system ATP-binding protein|nr:ATP-binding cassette domain-containing protein [Peptococcaceae bacterium]MDR2737220.1 ATP-binding cassette domain-containing protein [Gracilibacteraceae bacterium]